MDCGATDLVTAILVTALLVLLLHKITAKRRRFATLIDRLPGPRKYPLIGTGLTFLFTPRQELIQVASALSQKYSPIFRMWTGPFAEIHVTRPEVFEVVMGGMRHIAKGWAYDLLRPWLGEGLLTSTGSKWHSHRKMITPTFHFKILELFSDTFVTNSQILVEKLFREVDRHGEKGFDIYPLITHCALDMICETAMGVKVGAQEESHSEYVQAVCDISELTMYRGIRPWLYNDFVFSLTKEGKRYSQCLQVLHNFTNKVIQDRKLENLKKRENGEDDEDCSLGTKQRTAFLDLLLKANEDGHALSDVDIREEVDTFMFEGHDTTTAAISWALFLLGCYPEVQERVAEELDRIFGGSDRPITVRDTQEMKYLERVIKETLRLYPSVPFILRTVEGDTECGGYTFPDGVLVVIHIYQSHHSPEHFPDPEKFDPDNFLPERVQGRHPYAYIPFSAGPRNCIGQKFAMLEQKMVLASVLRHFKLRSVGRREDIKVVPELILRPEHGIHMVLTRREGIPKSSST